MTAGRHGPDIDRLRALGDPAASAAAELLAVHDNLGRCLDDGTREFVERHLGRGLDEAPGASALTKIGTEWALREHDGWRVRRLLGTDFDGSGLVGGENGELARRRAAEDWRVVAVSRLVYVGEWNEETS